jgi:hypothetical protein
MDGPKISLKGHSMLKMAFLYFNKGQICRVQWVISTALC